MHKDQIIIYDFDGVICDSVDVKTDAFIDLYKDYDFSIQNEIKKYHLMNGGISRYRKIEYFQNYILNKPLSQSEINDLAERFGSIVKNKVISSKYINGAKEFIERHAIDSRQFICSGTPNLEINEIVKKKEIAGLFDGIFGSPEFKASIIRKILFGKKYSKCIFFGDALTDYYAAMECSVEFIGIRNKNTNFPNGTNLIKDFKDQKLKIINL